MDKRKGMKSVMPAIKVIDSKKDTKPKFCVGSGTPQTSNFQICYEQIPLSLLNTKVPKSFSQRDQSKPEN